MAEWDGLCWRSIGDQYLTITHCSNWLTHKIIEQLSKDWKAPIYTFYHSFQMSLIILNHSKQFKTLLWKYSNKCYDHKKTFPIDALQEDTLQHIRWYTNYKIFEVLDKFSRTWTIKDIQCAPDSLILSYYIWLLWLLHQLVVECPHNHQSIIDYINLLFPLLFSFIHWLWGHFPLATLV